MSLLARFEARLTELRSWTRIITKSTDRMTHARSCSFVHCHCRLGCAVCHTATEYSGRKAERVTGFLPPGTNLNDERSIAAGLDKLSFKFRPASNLGS